MRNILLKISYDGTNYHGWQRQENAITIQQVLEDTIRILTKEPHLTVTGCGRTDAGVHAKEYVCNFFTDSAIPIGNFAAAVNSLLPKDICVSYAVEGEESFHARFDTVSKTYIYKILNRRIPDPFLRNYTMHYKIPLNLSEMIKATSGLMGTHDFKAFSSSGSPILNTVRTIYDLQIIENDGIITVMVNGDGFLYNMVRIIVGTLIYVGNGKIRYNEVGDILKSKNRANAGITAPPFGLYLDKVYYKEDLFGDGE